MFRLIHKLNNYIRFFILDLNEQITNFVFLYILKYIFGQQKSEIFNYLNKIFSTVIVIPRCIVKIIYFFYPVLQQN